MKMPQTIIAKAVAVEHNIDSDKLFVVFEIVDESFKQRVKKDWTQDLEVKLMGRNLIEEKT